LPPLATQIDEEHRRVNWGGTLWIAISERLTENVSNKNLIMGLWSHLPVEGLEKFLASLRRTTFDGDVCIFVDKVAPETVRALVSHGVIVETANSFYSPRMSPPVSRYFNYLDFLARNARHYDNVMISDLRDVIFQSDPFDEPLPADLVFAQERCLLRDCPTTGGWVREAYGELIFNTLRDWMISCSGTTFGTVSGMLQYLTAMTYEFSTKGIPLLGGLGQGIHNYVVRMRPPINAWFDHADSLVATLHYMPDKALAVTESGILIDGRKVPVIHQWDRCQSVADYVQSSPQFTIPSQENIVDSRPHAAAVRQSYFEAPKPVEEIVSKADAIISYYDRERHAGWLRPFLASARTVGFTGNMYCVGVFNQDELDLLAQYQCQSRNLDVRSAIVDPQNGAHLYMRSVLDGIARTPGQCPDQVLLVDTVRVTFLRNPFLTKTIGLSLFVEGAVRIGDSKDNLNWLSLFVDSVDPFLDKLIVSSSMLRGSVTVVQTFCRQLLAEFHDNLQLLSRPKIMQGVFNKLCHKGNLGYPVTLYPNGSVAYFDIGPRDLPVETQPIIRVGANMPSIIVYAINETKLTVAIRDNPCIQEKGSSAPVMGAPQDQRNERTSAASESTEDRAMSVTTPRSLPASFTVADYRAANREIEILNDNELFSHYVHFGREQGRICCPIDGRGALQDIIPDGTSVLEIGPGACPSFFKGRHDVAYLDSATTEQIRAVAPSMSWANMERLPTIDYVWSGQRYVDLIDRRFDAAFSCHNIEHQPCLVRHLNDVASILHPGSLFLLVIPDKRYCFDHFRKLTSIEDVLAAHIEGRNRHTAENILGHTLLSTHNNAELHWAASHGTNKQAEGVLISPSLIHEAVEEAQTAAAKSGYTDAHAWFFTPDSFAYLMQSLWAVRLIGFKVERIYHTVRNTNEFFAVLSLDNSDCAGTAAIE
jgi:hypothetical protein